MHEVPSRRMLNSSFGFLSVRLVAKQNDPGTELTCFSEPQVDLVVQRREHWRAAPQDDRMDVELVFIDQAELHEGRGDVGTAEPEVLAGLLFQLRDLFGDVLPYQPGVPFDPFKGLREHDLGNALPDVRVLDLILWARRVRIRRLPVAHDLIHTPSV